MSASGENGRNGAYYPREVRDVSTEREERKPGRPDGEDDVINKYGTYEVQRNNGEENQYPMIAQGLSRAEAMPGPAGRARDPSALPGDGRAEAFRSHSSGAPVQAHPDSRLRSRFWLPLVPSSGILSSYKNRHVILTQWRA